MPLALLAVALSLAAAAPAQQRGEIRLHVADPAGSGVEASGTLENLASGTTRRFRTGSRGDVAIPGVSYGRYRVEVTREGFEPNRATLDLNQDRLDLTVTLAIAPLKLVTVVSATPLAGPGLEPGEAPGPVQSAAGGDIERSGAAGIADFMNRRLTSVYVNEIQSNPVQPDVNYRGYTASPLLGTPQGLSIYMDGVRLNQPFGDVVSWDLIPRVAISEMALMPGSNPLFGLNTLGGALSIRTKDGYSYPGTALELGGGSFNRKFADLEHGGSSSKGLNWYLAGSLLFEDGWRESSPSNVRQLFARIGWQNEKTSISSALSYANNALIGNGLQEHSLLMRDYRSIYTKPDITANRSPMVNLMVRHAPSARFTLSGNGYYRHFRTRTLNGDLNDDALTQAVYQPNASERAALTAAGYTGFPLSGETAANTPFPFWRCIAQSLLQDEPAEKCNGAINRSNSTQHNYGFAGQGTWFTTGSAAGNRSQLTVGGAYDRSGVDFRQLTQLGYLNPDRSVTGVASFADGVTGGTEDGVPFDTRVNLNGKIHTASVFATDTFSAGSHWTVTLSGRFNRGTVSNSDRIFPTAGPGSLTGNHTFRRFNPSAGFTYRPAGSWSVYFNYSESNRAPTSIELGCADPNQPCRLPNAMTADPPLQQVVTRTIEAGARGGQESSVRWSAGWFRADNRGDILFVASEITGFGYFKNFGRTLRQGVEISGESRIGRAGIGAAYTLLDATFRTPESVNGSSNSANGEAVAGIPGVDGTIEIQPGNRIPLTPRHLLKTYADVQVTRKLLVDAGLIAVSGSYSRGNENNSHRPDGGYYLGPGRTNGYGVVNLGGRYQIHGRVQVLAQVGNLFNRRYYSASQLGPNGFTDTGAFLARPFPAISGEFPLRHSTFYAPGAPRAAWVGLRLRL